MLQIAPGMDPELSEHVLEVALDRPTGHEQCLCDLAVGHAVDCELCNAPLARGQRISAGDPVAAWTGAGGSKLVLGALGKRARPARASQIERMAQGTSGRSRLTFPSERGADVKKGGGQVMGCADALVDRRHLLELVQIGAAGVGQSTTAPAVGNVARHAVVARKLQCLLGDVAPFLDASGSHQRRDQRLRQSASDVGARFPQFIQLRRLLLQVQDALFGPALG